MKEIKERAKFVRVGGPYTLDEIFQHVSEKTKNTRIKLSDGHLVRVSNRILMFKENPKCVKCGLIGTVFYSEMMTCDKRPHLNFYAVKGGKETLMTKDHIIPKCFGGPDIYDNLQTMCTNCNGKKSNEPSALRELINIPEDDEVIKDLILNLLLCFNLLKREKNKDGGKKYAGLIKRTRGFINEKLKFGRKADDDLLYL